MIGSSPNKHRIGFILPALLLTAVGMMSGCTSESPLYGSLDEQRANQVVAVLLDNGIPCTKASGDDGAWSVAVSSSRFSEAVDILEQAGLPGQTFVGVGDMFSSTGMVSSPTEERIRFMYALAQDLSATLTEIDGVQSARVHVVLPENDPFRNEVKPSSASVFIKHRYDADMESQVPFIKNLVKDGIEGLQYDNISVALFRGEPPRFQETANGITLTTLFGYPVPQSSVPGLTRLFLGLGVFGVVALGACAVLLWLYFGKRHNPVATVNPS